MLGVRLDVSTCLLCLCIIMFFILWHVFMCIMMLFINPTNHQSINQLIHPSINQSVSFNSLSAIICCSEFHKWLRLKSDMVQKCGISWQAKESTMWTQTHCVPSSRQCRRKCSASTWTQATSWWPPQSTLKKRSSFHSIGSSSSLWWLCNTCVMWVGFH